MASQLTWESERFHSRVSAGTTAEPLNQSDIPSSSAMESKVSARHFRVAAIEILWSRERAIDQGEDNRWNHFPCVMALHKKMRWSVQYRERSDRMFHST